VYPSTLLPVGIGGFNNNSNSSNCYVEYSGFLNATGLPFPIAPGSVIGYNTSTFQFSFALGSNNGSNIPAYNASGSNAKMVITSYNGGVGGIASAVSDTFYYPSAHIGDTSYRMFLNMNIVDAVTQSTGFYVSSATAHFY
jgi:hypothetical protein